MTTKVKLLRFDENTLRGVIVDAFLKRAERGANKLARQLRKNLSTPGPTPSRTGEYPHKQSGELVRSVQVVRRNQFRVDVAVTAHHAPFVEARRPFLSRTVSEMMASLQREIGRGR